MSFHPGYMLIDVSHMLSFWHSVGYSRRRRKKTFFVKPPPGTNINTLIKVPITLGAVHLFLLVIQPCNVNPRQCRMATMCHILQCLHKPQYTPPETKNSKRQTVYTTPLSPFEEKWKSKSNKVFYTYYDQNESNETRICSIHIKKLPPAGFYVRSSHNSYIQDEVLIKKTNPFTNLFHKKLHPNPNF